MSYGLFLLYFGEIDYDIPRIYCIILVLMFQCLSQFVRQTPYGGLKVGGLIVLSELAATSAITAFSPAQSGECKLQTQSVGDYQYCGIKKNMNMKYTVRCHHNAVQYDMILHSSLQWLR